VSEADIGALWVTLRLALTTTVILLLLGTPLAWWLSRTQCKTKVLIEALVAIPLVLPPTVLGFYLLIMLAPDGPIGALWQSVGGETLAFSFSGLVIGSVLYSLPFVVQPLQIAFTNIGNHYLEAASTLRASPLNCFFTLVVPLAKPGFITAATLGFAHTIGEFGVVLMIGGNIPGETQVLSIAIYDHVESLEYANAHILSGGLLVFSLVVLILVYGLNRQSPLNGRYR